MYQLNELKEVFTSFFVREGEGETQYYLISDNQMIVIYLAGTHADVRVIDREKNILEEIA